MPEPDQLVLDAQIDAHALESFVKRSTPFILHSVFRVTHRFSTVHDDEYAVALEAFVEAVKAFDPQKGSFLSFAYLVIKRRLIDSFKKNQHSEHEISVEPDLLAGKKVGSSDEPHHTHHIVAPYIVEDFTLQWEIESLAAQLTPYNISFPDLVDCSPKSGKTKNICANAVILILKSPELLEYLAARKNLPLKVLENTFKLPRKTLEAHRKYIIAAVKIMTGDYPLLSEYLKPMKEAMER